MGMFLTTRIVGWRDSFFAIVCLFVNGHLQFLFTKRKSIPMTSKVYVNSGVILAGKSVLNNEVVSVASDVDMSS